MSSDFLEKFATQIVRESGGSRSSNRFDYQKNWSLCQLLRLHKKHSDYLMVFEHHDDIVVFDSETQPAKATFYQVKTKTSGNWTVAALTKSDGDKKSILEKLYDNYLRFSDNVEGLVFTSNQPLASKLRNGDKSVDVKEVRFHDLADKEKEKIHSSVEPTDLKYCDLAGLSKIVTNKNDLRVDDHTSITKGQLVEFFEQIVPEYEVNISLVYKTFFDEIRRKTNYEREITSDSDLLRHKSIGQSQFQSMVSTAVSRRSNADLWIEGNALLASEGFSFMEVRSIRENWDDYVVNKMNASDELHLTFVEVVVREIQCLEGKGESFKDISAKLSMEIKKKCESVPSEEYMRAAILYEILRNDPIPTIDQEFTEEAE